MKLSDFLLEFPDQLDAEESEEIGNMEVKILVQATNNIVINTSDVEVDIREIETNWNTNTILIKAEYI